MQRSFSAGTARQKTAALSEESSIISSVLGDKHRETMRGSSFLCPAIAAATPGDRIESRANIPQIQLMLISEKEKEEKHYWNLKKTLEKFENALPLSELQQLYTAVFNYCNKKLKSGNEAYLQEIFDWYKVMLRKGSLITNGQITPYIHFRNIVMAGLRLGQLDWTAQFIEQYESFIAEEVRQNMVLYCRAALFFYKKDYAKSLEFLAQFELKDFFYYIEHKLLLIKVYFELEEDEALENLLHSFRIYLHRKSNLPPHLKQSYHNFARLTEKLYKAQFTPNFDAQILHDEIPNTAVLTDKEWLLEKF